ncbi:biotin synthase BioB [Aliidiomarina celeris]|uniref:biotin synthase BioB n=1 Tax=Aliidiomarina celeris TaxID=2249428 RepID=UPI000DEA75BC|nr:biotin synthase BioB [Aliidiomarina celeris]
MTSAQPRYSRSDIQRLFDTPFNNLLFQAQSVHRRHFNPNEVQVSTLLSIKTGACPEDCKYCPQSARYDTGLEKEALMEVQAILEQAARAKETGASRFCMGAAWRNPKERDMPKLIAMIEGVRELGLETCMTLGMLSPEQAEKLGQAGLDYYNHNLDTSPEFYGDIITTRTYQDRLNTLQNVRDAGMKVCSGGIVGMGEEQSDRIGLLQQLANMEQPPESVPINMLVKVAGTPMAEVEDLDPFEFVRTIAVARILMPASHVRLSAGRETMSDELQALCFFAGANSIFYGEKLLTTANPVADADQRLFARLGIVPEQRVVENPPEEVALQAASETNELFYNAMA